MADTQNAEPVEDKQPKLRPTDVHKPRLRRVGKFAQTPLGIWFLSSVVLGVISWGYAQNLARIQATRQREELIQRLDGEARSRIHQWFKMCEVRWIRQTYGGTKFQEWYASLIKPPFNPKEDLFYMYAVYLVYSEFADQSLLALATQLRSNVSDREGPPIEGVIEWLSAWNPDLWENKLLTSK